MQYDAFRKCRTSVKSTIRGRHEKELVLGLGSRSVFGEAKSLSIAGFGPGLPSLTWVLFVCGSGGGVWWNVVGGEGEGWGFN